MPKPIKGARRPSFSVTPKIPKDAYNFGDEVLEIGELLGLTLQGWQQDLAELWTTQAKGKWVAKEACLMVPRQNGKSLTLAVIEIAKAVLGRAKTQAYTAHLVPTADEHFELLKTLMTSSKLASEVLAINNQRGKQSIKFRNNSRIIFIARSKHGGRGISVDSLVIDEAQTCTPSSLAALIPMTTASKNAQVFFSGSAPIAYDSASEIWRNKQMRGRLGGVSDNFAYSEWGLNSMPALLDDPELWASVNPGLGSTVGVSNLALNHASMNEEDFLREILGFCADGNLSGVDFALWEQAYWSGEYTSPAVFGLDCYDGDFVLVAARYVDGLASVETVAVKPGFTSALEVIKRAIDAGICSAVGFDGSQTSITIWEQELKRLGVPLWELNPKEVIRSHVGFGELLEGGLVRQKAALEVGDGLASAVRFDVKGGWHWKRKDGLGCAGLFAACVGVHVARNRGARDPFLIS